MAASAKSDALKSIISDANSARLGDKLPKDKRSRLLHLIKEELEEDKDEKAKTDDSDKD